MPRSGRKSTYARCPDFPSQLLNVPRTGDLDGHKSALEGAWQHMLGHQLPALPPVEAFWGVLPEFFRWLEEEGTPGIPASYVASAGETIIRERTLRLALRPATQSALEIIRFAAASRLCVDLAYEGRTRRIEPYSLRRTKDGNIILHTWSVESNAHRSYRVDRIESAQATNQTFTPRYAVELTPAGPVIIPPTALAQSFRPAKQAAALQRTGFSSGPTYVYQCPHCQKKFKRKTRTNALNPHKGQSGYQCPGRSAILVNTEY